MQGRDLFDPAGRRDGVLIDDYGMAVFDDPDARAGLMSFVTGRWRVSIHEGSDWGELYDLGSDAHELRNLWNDPAHLAQRQALVHRLLREMVALRDRRLTPTMLA